MITIVYVIRKENRLILIRKELHGLMIKENILGGAKIVVVNNGSMWKINILLYG